MQINKGDTLVYVKINITPIKGKSKKMEILIPGLN